MAPVTTAELSILLRSSRAGDPEAQARLFETIHGELSQIASFLLRRELRQGTLATGDLVNEAVIRLLQSPDVDAHDRGHFLAIASRVMRQVLIDAGRKRQADKRKHFDVTLTERNVGGSPGFDVDLHRLETALLRLKAVDPERADIVIMRYYGGMSIEDIAAALNVSESTVKRSWRSTRLWLREAIENDEQG